jgi:hypothetical protein
MEGAVPRASYAGWDSRGGVSGEAAELQEGAISD